MKIRVIVAPSASCCFGWACSRGSDASTAWLVTALKAFGAMTTHIAWALVPLMGLWVWLATMLAREEKRRSASS